MSGAHRDAAGQPASITQRVKALAALNGRVRRELAAMRWRDIFVGIAQLVALLLVCLFTAALGVAVVYLALTLTLSP